MAGSRIKRILGGRNRTQHVLGLEATEPASYTALGKPEFTAKVDSAPKGFKIFRANGIQETVLKDIFRHLSKF